MDWGSVTSGDLMEALREVDWSSAPRTLNEFFSRFTLPPPSSNIWTSRLCNLYYYRTNYFIMIIFILGTFSEKVTRTVRRFSPHLAAKMRTPLTPVIRGRPSSKRSIHICGRPRWLFVSLFSAASFILWFVSCGLLILLWAITVGILATVLHASFRTPNLKARIHSVRSSEQFGAITLTSRFRSENGQVHSLGTSNGFSGGFVTADRAPLLLPYFQTKTTWRPPYRHRHVLL